MWFMIAMEGGSLLMDTDKGGGMQCSYGVLVTINGVVEFYVMMRRGRQCRILVLVLLLQANCWVAGALEVKRGSWIRGGRLTDSRGNKSGWKAKGEKVASPPHLTREERKVAKVTHYFKTLNCNLSSHSFLFNICFTILFELLCTILFRPVIYSVMNFVRHMCLEETL